MTKIYIVRHGQTDSNLRNACIGHKDVPLNNTGTEQARKLAARLSGFEFEAVYTSPLARAVNTVMPAVEMNRGTKLIMNYGLIERDFGLWDDMSFEEIEKAYPKEYKSWRENWYTYRPPEGESIVDMHSRAAETMDKIIGAHSDSDILIVTHLGISRSILSYMLGLSPEQSWCFRLENTGIAVVEYTDGKGILTGFNI